MTASAPAADPAPVTLDQSPELTLTALYRAAIGPINTNYYLPLFERFEATGKTSVSWNTAACLYHLNWMLFRGMRGAALAYAAAVLVLALALVALGGLAWGGPLSWARGALIGSVVLALGIPGVWGNALFFNHCHKALMAAVEANPTIKTACEQLSRQASSRQRFVRILLGNGLLLAAVCLTWTLVPVDEPPVNPEMSSALPARAASTTASAPASTPASDTVPASIDPAASAVAAASATPALTPASTPASAPARPVPVAQPERPADTPQFYVNAGLFANADNARNVLAKLQQAGLPAFAQLLEMPNGTRTRVRVGPFAKRAQAQAAVAKIRALKLDAVLANAN